MIEEVQFYPCRDVYEEGMALLAGLEDAALDARLLLEPLYRVGRCPDPRAGYGEPG